MGSGKAQDLRVLLGLTIKLRAYAETIDDLGDIERFLSVALALEDRANRLAFGEGGTSPPPHQEIVIPLLIQV
jgi:hypothetical protein